MMSEWEVKIEDTDTGTSAPVSNLAGVLDCVPNASRRHWYICYLYATSEPGTWNLSRRGPFPDFEERINNSTYAIEFSWESLRALADEFVQIIDLVLVGASSGLELSSRDTQFLIDEPEVDVVIEWFDSTPPIKVLTRLGELPTCLQSSFESVELTRLR